MPFLVAENITKQGEKKSVHPGWLKQHERPGVHQQGISSNYAWSSPSHSRAVCLAHTELPTGESSFLRAQELPSAHLGDTSLCTDYDRTHCFCKVGQGLTCLSAHSTASHRLGRGVVCVHVLSGGCCFPCWQRAAKESSGCPIC